MWDLSCQDWEDRIRTGQSLVPDLPLNRDEADLGLAFFDNLRLPDVPGNPLFKNEAGQWFRDIVEAAFGSWDPVRRERYIRDIFALVPKGSSKTTYSAALTIAVMLMNERPNAEALFVGPTQAIADRAFDQAEGMIKADPSLMARFHPMGYNKTILDRKNGSVIKVRTFDVNVMTGAILIFALVDEIHLLGRNAHTTKVLRQIRGGLDKTPEGLLMMTTTQSDSRPTGAFAAELKYARAVRDGEMRGRVMRPMLPVLYEFPLDIAKDPEQWQDTANWPMVMPNLNRPIGLNTLIPDWEAEKTKGPEAVQVWASQHLNIEIGVGTKYDGWAGAEYWDDAAIEGLTLDKIISQSDVVLAGIDGGGLDDLLGFGLLGRHRETRAWVWWCHAWAHDRVLDRRKGEESVLRGFEADGDLTIVSDMTEAFEQLAEMCLSVWDAGLLLHICMDTAGVGMIVDAIGEAGMPTDAPFIAGIRQGWTLQNAIKTAEVKASNGTLVHCGQPIMAWSVGNAKTEMRGSALMITKQISGSAKIDPLMAMFDAVAMMSKNPKVATKPKPKIFVL